MGENAAGELYAQTYTPQPKNHYHIRQDKNGVSNSTDALTALPQADQIPRLEQVAAAMSPAACCFSQSAHDGPFGQLDLEIVVPEAAGAAQQHIRRAPRLLR